MFDRKRIMAMISLLACVAVGNPIALPYTTVTGGIPVRPKPFRRPGLYRVETVNVETNGGQVVRIVQHTRMTTPNSPLRHETNTWTEVIKGEEEEREVDGLIFGKNFCGLVFGDVYPDKCEGVQLSTPFFLFDELNFAYDQRGVLIRIAAQKEISCRYGTESVLRAIKEMKELIERHLGIVMTEPSNYKSEGHADPDEFAFYDTSEVSKKKAYFCEARRSGFPDRA